MSNKKTSGKGTVVKEGKKKGKKEEPAPAPIPKKKRKKANSEPVEPIMVEQLNEKGEVELVDQNKFPFPITCEDCGSVRYVNAAGLKTVKKCKLCSKKNKRRIQSKARRGKVKIYAAVVKDALEQGLFPDKFKKKHGLV